MSACEIPWGAYRCPICGSSWTGGQIPEESREHYGGALFFHRAIVLCDRTLDKSVGMRCPDCGHTWGRSVGVPK